MNQANRRYLIIAPAWVGDMIMAQTLFKLIHTQWPTAIIDVIAPASTAPLLSRMPEVNQTIPLSIGHGELSLSKRYQLAKQLRSTPYTHAIVLPNSWKSALIPWFAKIPIRTGWRGEFRVGLLNDLRILHKTMYPRMIDQFMALGLPPQTPLPTDITPHLQTSPYKIKEILKKFNLTTTKPVLVLCPGAEYGPAKRWPTQHFARVAAVQHQAGWDIWIIGSSKETPLAQNIQKNCNSICQDLTGKTNLSDAIDCIAASTAVISNDSGLMHIAAALKKPLIAIYGSSSPAFTPPLATNAKIVSLNLPCSPCFKRECPLEHLNCLKQLSPERILSEVSHALAAH